MKKILAGLLTVLILFSLTSCFTAEEQTDFGKTEQETENFENEEKGQESMQQEDVVTEPEPERDPEPTAEDSYFKIKFIDVGQADSALVCCDGKYMLIDGGNVGDSDVIYTVLKKENVQKLDMVVGTHAHEDHIGGLPAAYKAATVGLTLCPVTEYDSNAFSNFASSAKETGGIVVPKVNDEYSLGSAKVKILAVNSGTDTNDTSIVLKITYGQTTFLFTGDAEREAEQVILSSGADISSTVLKVGHHGSETSISYPFLREIMPKYAVISVGKGNTYGHPTDAALSRLRDADVTLFRTDLQGDILCESDGKNVTFTVSKNKDAEVFGSIGENSTQREEKEEQKPEEEQKTTYILNTNTKKFHYEDCRSVKGMNDKNKASSTLSRNELIKAGYSPCGTCKP